LEIRSVTDGKNQRGGEDERHHPLIQAVEMDDFNIDFDVAAWGAADETLEIGNTFGNNVQNSWASIIDQTLEIRSLNDGENQSGGDGELHHPLIAAVEMQPNDPFDVDVDEDLLIVACDDADKDRVLSVPR
jgi:hypothetical protein